MPRGLEDSRHKILCYTDHLKCCSLGHLIIQDESTICILTSGGYLLQADRESQVAGLQSQVSGPRQDSAVSYCYFCGTTHWNSIFPQFSIVSWSENRNKDILQVNAPQRTSCIAQKLPYKIRSVKYMFFCFIHH